MQRNVLIVCGILVALIGIIQVTAIQQQTTIPGLLFPSATPTSTLTPTHTLTPTNTLTPTLTLTATKTLTPTPDVYAICSAKLSEFYALRKEQLDVVQEISVGVANIVPHSSSAYETLIERFQTWSFTYAERLGKNSNSCSRYAEKIAANDISIHIYFTMALNYMKDQDFASASYALRQGQIVARENETFESLMANEISEYRQRAPQYSWPNVP